MLGPIVTDIAPGYDHITLSLIHIYGMVFQDSDVAKWIEAAAYALAAGDDPELEKAGDETIQLYGASQHEEGYVDSYFTVKCPDKMWTNICDAHELYCAGPVSYTHLDVYKRQAYCR